MRVEPPALKMEFPPSEFESVLVLAAEELVVVDIAQRLDGPGRN